MKIRFNVPINMKLIILGGVLILLSGCGASLHPLYMPESLAPSSHNLREVDTSLLLNTRHPLSYPESMVELSSHFFKGFKAYFKAYAPTWNVITSGDAEFSVSVDLDRDGISVWADPLATSKIVHHGHRGNTDIGISKVSMKSQIGFGQQLGLHAKHENYNLGGKAARDVYNLLAQSPIVTNIARNQKEKKRAGQRAEEKAKRLRKELSARKTRCLQANDTVSCQEYLKTATDLSGINEAKKILREGAALKMQVRMATLRKNQVCKLKEGKWLYSSKTCVNNLAHGKGVALHLNGQLKFEGTFNKGVRVTGLLSYNNAPMYDGPIAAGKPDGMGICFHKGEPEECKYYKGKRVDVIYKQRIAMLEQQRIMDAKIKQMADQQKQQLDAMQENIDSVKSRSASGRSGDDEPTTLGGVLVDAAADKLRDKAADKAVDLLFDALF